MPSGRQVLWRGAAALRSPLLVVAAAVCLAADVGPLVRSEKAEDEGAAGLFLLRRSAGL